MPINSLKAGKVLLTAGLLLVLAQGLWELPELQDYLSPGYQLVADLQTVGGECRKIEADLIALRDRVNYLKWLMAQRGHHPKFSVNCMLCFSFSEPIRAFCLDFLWRVNIYLAQKTRVREERRLQYLDALLNRIDLQFQKPSGPNGPGILPENAAGLGAVQQVKTFQHQWSVYNITLNDLIEQLAWIEKHDYKK